MTGLHLETLLATAEAKKDPEGWSKLAEHRHLTLYVSGGGSTLTVSRIETVRVNGGLVEARTSKGEVFVLALEDLFAGSIDASASSGRKAGFV